MDSVEVDACGEEIGRARESQRREIAAVTAAPGSDFCGVDVGTVAEVESGALHVVVLACSAGSVVDGLAEVQAVSDAAAIVD